MVALPPLPEEEARRGDTIRHHYRRIALLIALPVALIALIPSTAGLVILARYADHNCKVGQANRDAIRATLLGTFINLGYRFDEETNAPAPAGKPLAYYAEHPGERKRALEQAVATLALFPPITCNYLWTF